MQPGDDQVQGAVCQYGDPIMEDLLSQLQPEVERATGLALFPTYSYLRVYKHKDILRRHTDRPSCEISISLCLGYEAPRPWLISIEGPIGISQVSLCAGDALLYRGISCPHWRDRFEGEWLVQVFLHYVDQVGPCKQWKYDKRAALGAFLTPRAGTGELQIAPIDGQAEKTDMPGSE
jgi:hypothetical protein